MGAETSVQADHYIWCANTAKLFLAQPKKICEATCVLWQISVSVCSYVHCRREGVGRDIPHSVPQSLAG